MPGVRPASMRRASWTRPCERATRTQTRSFVEIFVIIIPPFIALLLGAWALLSPPPVDSVAERKQLDEHIAWLDERLAHARARNWDEQMMANLQAQMAEARRRQQALAVA